jgi:hypothetical protein
MTELDEEIEDLEERILNLKHKRARISLYPPIKLGEEKEINLITSTELEFKIEITGRSVDTGMYFAKFSCEDEPGEDVFLKVNENNEITEIIISHKEYYEWSDWNESYVYTNRDTKGDIKFKKVY